jgi:hypothetical protein
MLVPDWPVLLAIVHSVQMHSAAATSSSSYFPDGTLRYPSTLDCRKRCAGSESHTNLSPKMELQDYIAFPISLTIGFYYWLIPPIPTAFGTIVFSLGAPFTNGWSRPCICVDGVPPSFDGIEMTRARVVSAGGTMGGGATCELAPEIDKRYIPRPAASIVLFILTSILGSVS